MQERSGTKLARVYKVSADTSEKEKIIGGVLTLGQGLWCAAGLLLSAGIFLLVQTFLPVFLALIIAVPPGGFVIWTFGFKTKYGYPYLTYLTLNKKFQAKNKYLINTLTYGKEFEEL